MFLTYDLKRICDRKTSPLRQMYFNSVTYESLTCLFLSFGGIAKKKSKEK